MIWTDLTLAAKNYDGLYCAHADCACKVHDLRPCGNSISETLMCKPGHILHEDEFGFTIGKITAKGEKGTPGYTNGDEA